MNAQERSSRKRPNIVFMLTDNLGYGELGCYGGGVLRGAPTPRIDALASEGMRLLNFNVEAQCILGEFVASLKKYPPIKVGTPAPYLPPNERELERGEAV
jgi:Sulfatase